MKSKRLFLLTVPLIILLIAICPGKKATNVLKSLFWKNCYAQQTSCNCGDIRFTSERQSLGTDINYEAVTSGQEVVENLANIVLYLNASIVNYSNYKTEKPYVCAPYPSGAFVDARFRSFTPRFKMFTFGVKSVYWNSAGFTITPPSPPAKRYKIEVPGFIMVNVEAKAVVKIKTWVKVHSYTVRGIYSESYGSWDLY